MKSSTESRRSWPYLSQLSINYLGWVFCWTIATSYLVPNTLLNLVDDSIKNTRLGIMSGAGNIMVIILIPLIGSLSDRTRSDVGRRRPYFLLAACAMGVLVLLIARSQRFIELLALMVLMHASLALWFPNRALIRDTVPLERRGRISGIITITNMLGMMFAHLAAPRLIDAGKMVVLAMAAAAANIFSNAWVAFGVTEVQPLDKPERLRLREVYFPALSGSSHLRWLAAFNLFTQMGMVAMVCFLLYFIKDQIDAEHFNATFANVVLIAMAAGLPSSLTSGLLADRFGRKRVLLAACLLQLACILNFLFSPRTHSTMYMSGVLYGLGNGAYLSMYWTIVSDMVPEAEASKYIGLMQYTFLIPWAVIPPTLGPIVDNFGANSGLGYNIFFVIISFLLILGMVLIPKIPETLKKAAPLPLADAT
jgi:MFS family permease